MLCEQGRIAPCPQGSQSGEVAQRTTTTGALQGVWKELKGGFLEEAKTMQEHEG